MPLPLIPIIVIGAVAAAGGSGALAAPRVVRRFGSTKVLIVGPSGAGKSTLAALLERASRREPVRATPRLKITDPANAPEVKELIRERTKKSDLVCLVMPLHAIDDPTVMSVALRHAKHVSLEATDKVECVLVLSHLDGLSSDEAESVVRGDKVSNLRIALGASRTVAVNLLDETSASAVLGTDDPAAAPE